MDRAHDLEHLTPKSVVDKWLERKGVAGYVVLVTLVGVETAILLGVVCRCQCFPSLGVLGGVEMSCGWEQALIASIASVCK